MTGGFTTGMITLGPQIVGGATTGGGVRVQTLTSGMLISGMQTGGGQTVGTGMFGVAHAGGAMSQGTSMLTGQLTGKDPWSAQPQVPWHPPLGQAPPEMARAISKSPRRIFFINLYNSCSKSSNL